MFCDQCIVYLTLLWCISDVFIRLQCGDIGRKVNRKSTQSNGPEMNSCVLKLKLKLYQWV